MGYGLVTRGFLITHNDAPQSVGLLWTSETHVEAVAYPGIFSGGFQQIELRTDNRENGNLGALAP
jgi:hypothetical protein